MARPKTERIYRREKRVGLAETAATQIAADQAEAAAPAANKKRTTSPPKTSSKGD